MRERWETSAVLERATELQCEFKVWTTMKKLISLIKKLKLKVKAWLFQGPYHKYFFILC